MPRIAFRQVRGRKTHPNWTGIVDEVKRTLETKTKPELIKKFKERVADWKHQPKFKARKSVRRGGIIIYVFPTGKNKNIWKWVSFGTKPHVIRPKFKKALAFPSLSSPKTLPIDVYGLPSGSAGPTIVVMEVEHPGTVARKFEQGIGEEYKPIFVRDMENAMRRGARRA